MSSEPQKAVAAPVTHHNPSFLWDMSAGGFAQISVADPGRLAFLSGQVGGAPDGEHLPPDLTSQAYIVAANLKKALTELGASANDVVMVRLYVVNATTGRFQQALTALRDTFSGGKPSITTIGVQALYTPDYQLEVEMVVRVP
ncbi:enamine deaminase RidA (YjgF/YER057c/UK114 family) [Paraburkholderia sp. BL27I4N3]|uniref:RidA family protein n=1 Tax=Paraburkholderia sp. BL27I4N3 TaxID=1938805 RepID=UPI000E231C59|nr:RidA family protein [Paraburkholderia sp. BL27I4N3]REE07231.1 enamine deaminase RidA (YjgF/YER057c/UK114 family) [Paraburkholderia sp. BL27I4N3]